MNMTVAKQPETDFLDQEFQLSQQLLQVLEQEKLALMANDIDALSAVTPEKLRLASSFLARRQLLLRERSAHAQAGQAQSQPDNAQSASAQRREKLLALQQAARQANLTNGLMLQRLTARNQAALAVLLGPSAQGFYGPDGQGMNSSFFAR